MPRRNLVLLYAALVLSGCNQNSAWYDYGNGLVNLNNVDMISSHAALLAEAEPKMKVNEHSGDEQIVRYQAHSDYCGDKFQAYRRQGTIPELDNQAKALFNSLEKAATSEFLQTCRLNISGQASISFDQFSLQLSGFNARVDYPGPTTAEESKALLAERLGFLAKGQTPWHDDYNNVVAHTRPATKIW